MINKNKPFIDKLRSSGLRPTRQRVEISKFLFGSRKTFHFTVDDLNKLIKMHRQMSDMMKKIGRKNGRGMLRNLLGDLTGSKSNNDDFEKILENNPNFSRHLSSQLSQKNFSNVMGNIPGFMKKK